jgi:hypothetical protein
MAGEIVNLGQFLLGANDANISVIDVPGTPQSGQIRVLQPRERSQTGDECVVTSLVASIDADNFYV